MNNRGITLMELICVLAILAAVMAASAPRLATFFSGRTLAEESRRFLALTRYARSEAVSRSVLMELWIEPAAEIYGLKPQVSYSTMSGKPLEFTLAEELRFDIDAEQLDEQGKARILFWPDGAIDDASLQELSIWRNEEEKITIVQADFGMGYVIQEEEDND